MIGAVCLSPVSEGGPLFTELCRPNKTLLSSLLSHLACQAGIPLADETQKSKFGQLLCTGATNGTGHTPHSTVHDEAASPVGHQASDTPHPQTLSAVSATRFNVRSCSPLFLAKNAERQRDPVWSGAADTGRKMRCLQLTAEFGRLVQVMGNRHRRTLPSSLQHRRIPMLHLQTITSCVCEQLETHRAGSGVCDLSNRAKSSRLDPRFSSTPRTPATTACHGSATMGPTKTQIALAIAACPRSKKLGTQSPRVRLGDRRLEARIVYLTLCQSPPADQSPWLSALLGSRYGSPVGHCCRPAVLCHP